MDTKNKRTQFVVKAALLGVLGFLLMMLEFPIPFIPPWLKLDLSDVSVIIAGYGLGPIGAVAVAFIKNLLHLLLKYNDGTFVGDIAAFIISISIALPACMIYRKHKTKKSMMTGLVVGSITMIVLAGVLNAFVLLPAYSVVFGMPMEGLVAMATKVNPAITSVSTLVFWGVTPFNVIKCILLAILTYLLYNRIEKIVSLN